MEKIITFYNLKKSSQKMEVSGPNILTAYIIIIIMKTAQMQTFTSLFSNSSKATTVLLIMLTTKLCFSVYICS
jgi:hypothetical protein